MPPDYPDLTPASARCAIGAYKKEKESGDFPEMAWPGFEPGIIPVYPFRVRGEHASTPPGQMYYAP